MMMPNVPDIKGENEARDGHAKEVLSRVGSPVVGHDVHRAVGDADAEDRRHGLARAAERPRRFVEEL